jgi:hypothetical protein
MKKPFNTCQFGRSPRRKKITEPNEPKIRPSMIIKNSVTMERKEVKSD